MQTHTNMLRKLVVLVMPLAALAVKEVAVAVPFTAVPPAQCASATSIWNTPAGSTTSDGAVQPWACFSLGTNALTLNLLNVQQNVKGAGQEISAISFFVSGAQGSGATISSDAGALGTIAAGGSYTLMPPASNPLDNWTVSQSGTGVTLTALSGGKPSQLIIGPDSAGGITGDGTYLSANGSIVQHNPSVLELATFVLDIPGVTPESIITDVVFDFGSLPVTNRVGGIEPPLPGNSTPSATPASVPVPATIMLFALGLVGLASRRRSC